MGKLDVMFPLSFSNSSLSSFNTCSLKGFRSSIQKLVGNNVKTSGHLLAGGAFAAACEEARKAYYVEKVSQEEAVARGVDIIEDWEDTGHAIKTNERVALTFRKYLKEFPFVDTFRPCELVDGSHAIEYEFSLDTGIAHPDLPDRNITYTGILDGLYEKIVAGEIVSRFVLDEKTTGSVFRIEGSKCAAYPNGLVDLDKELNLFKTSSQMIGYSYAANSLGIKIDSALIRRAPILTKHEAAYELKIPITPFMREMWAISTFEFITELKERYVYYRDKVKEVKGSYPHSVFYPTYSNSCNAWGEECRYMAGCLNKEGGQVLAVTHKQMVGERVDGKRVLTPLKEYKERFGL